MTSSTSRNLIDHPAPGDRYDYNGTQVDVYAAPIVVPKGFRIPIMLMVDTRPEVWMRFPWLNLHKHPATRLLRTAEQFIKQIKAAGHSLSVLEGHNEPK